MNNKPTKLTLAFLLLEYNTYIREARKLGFSGSQATQRTNQIMKKQYGPDCLRIMEIGRLMHEEQEDYLPASDLGQRLGGITAQQVRMLLKFKGLIESYRDSENRIFWRPTKKGEPFISFGNIGPKHSAGASGQQLLYRECIMENFTPEEMLVN